MPQLIQTYAAHRTDGDDRHIRRKFVGHNLREQRTLLGRKQIDLRESDEPRFLQEVFPVGPQFVEKGRIFSRQIFRIDREDEQEHQVSLDVLQELDAEASPQDRKSTRL